MKKRIFSHHTRICILLFLTYLLVTAIPAYGVPVVSTRLTMDKSWDPGVLSIIGAVTTLAYAGASVPVGIMIRKIGNKKTGKITILFTIAAFAVLSLTDLPWYLYLLVFLAFGIGSTGVLLLTPGILNCWFDRNKALPTSLVLSAGAVGGFIFPQLAARLLAISIRVTWIVFLSIEILSWIVFMLFVRERPEEVGEIRDGRAWVNAHPLTMQAEEAKAKATFPELKDCYRSSQFIKLLIQIIGMRAINAALMNYLVFFVMQREFTSAQAATCLSVVSLVGLGGRLFAGSLDKLRIPYYLANVVSFAGMAAGMLLLGMGKSYAMLVAGSALAGASFGLNYNLFVLLVPKVFGNENFSVLFGTFNMIGFAGAALGPVALYALARVSGYGAAYLLFGMVSVLCGVSAVLLPIRPAAVKTRVKPTAMDPARKQNT